MDGLWYIKVLVTCFVHIVEINGKFTDVWLMAGRIRTSDQ